MKFGGFARRVATGEVKRTDGAPAGWEPLAEAVLPPAVPERGPVTVMMSVEPRGVNMAWGVTTARVVPESAAIAAPGQLIAGLNPGRVMTPVAERLGLKLARVHPVVPEFMPVVRLGHRHAAPKRELVMTPGAEPPGWKTTPRLPVASPPAVRPRPAVH